MITQVVTVFNDKYKYVPPDGAWGHLITASCIVMNYVVLIPLSGFGLLYGDFLANIGNETKGSALSNGIFNAVQSFTGLLTVFLLRNYSFRKVGLAGAVLFSVGAGGLIFVQNLTQMIFYFGILQGLGLGLMMPATMSAFISYFSEKLNLMMGLYQAILVVGNIGFPPAIDFLMRKFGFKRSLAIMACWSLLNFPAMAVLQPVKWHMKRVPADVSNDLDSGTTHKKSESLKRVILNDQRQSLLEEKPEGGSDQDSLEMQRELSVISWRRKYNTKQYVNEFRVKKGISDFGLLKDPKYLNISCGLALSMTADTAFIFIIPMVLNDLHFEWADTVTIMTVHFCSDFIARIIYSVIGAMFNISNRYIFLAGSLLSAIFRIVFVLNDTYMWKLVTISILGFVRCFIQTPYTLVISEEYNDNFPTAFSLLMVVNGFISLIFGSLMSYVQSLTQSDLMVLHLLTGAYLLSGFSWLIELLYEKMSTEQNGS